MNRIIVCSLFLASKKIIPKDSTHLIIFHQETWCYYLYILLVSCNNNQIININKMSGNYKNNPSLNEDSNKMA